jgi:hypothetical protein
MGYGCLSVPFPSSLQCFSASGHPEALVACYVASWQLPRPDFHRLADDSLSGHTNELLGGIPLLGSGLLEN